ncbi:MAG: hypothetical protein RQ899_01105 [Pseudomonadales bacterium]|nr:hypothetical protein [Pseudomonadales bacterium]
MPINRQVISYALYLVGLLFVIYILRQAWPELSAQLAQARFGFLAASTVAIGVHTLLGCLLLNRLFHAAGIAIGYGSTCRIFYLSQLAKYLPGVIWGFALQASLLQSENIMSKVVLANIRQMLLTLSSFFFYALAIIFWKISLPLALLLLVFSYPAIHLVRNFSFPRSITRQLARLAPSLSVLSDRDRDIEASTLSILVLCLMLFASYLLGISLMLLALYDISVYAALELAVYQALAWVAGVLAFLVPAGMGVREAVFLLLGNLNGAFSPEQIQAMAIFTRTVQMVQDLLFSLLAVLLSSWFAASPPARK